ncbi:hypothetical protein SprV_0301045200 [Sparganum proliferum]
MAPTVSLCVPRRGIVQGWCWLSGALPAALHVVGIVWILRLILEFCAMAGARTSSLRKKVVSRGQLHGDALRPVCSSRGKVGDPNPGAHRSPPIWWLP